MKFEVVVPALHFRTSDGRLDKDTTRRYATEAASTWVDRFVISGSTSRGDLLNPTQRAELLDLWLEVADAARLLACAWSRKDLAHAEDRGITPLAVMQGLNSHREACDFFAQLPPSACVYSHPMYSVRVLDPTLAESARALAVLPSGAKTAKASISEIKAIREIATADFKLWDGSCRRIRASLDAGASGVVATPLTALPAPFPERSVAALQRAVDSIQAELDRRSSRAGRLAHLIELARARDWLL